MILRTLTGYLFVSLVLGASHGTSAPLSITITNQSETELSLEIFESPRLPSHVEMAGLATNPPPSQLPPPQVLPIQTNPHPSIGEIQIRLEQIRSALLSNTPPPVPARANTMLRALLHQRVTIRSNDATVLKLEPGEYRLGILPPQANGAKGIVGPLSGYLTVTNSETWCFKLEAQERRTEVPVSATAHKQPPQLKVWEWKLQVPSRPGLHLMTSPGWLGSILLRPERVVTPPALLGPTNGIAPTADEAVLLYEANRLRESSRRLSTNAVPILPPR